MADHDLGLVVGERQPVVGRADHAADVTAKGLFRCGPSTIVIEEVWSISSNANERRLLDTSERPLFWGGSKRLAYARACQQISIS
jgi:hypothetical protein